MIIKMLVPLIFHPRMKRIPANACAYTEIIADTRGKEFLHICPMQNIILHTIDKPNADEKPKD